MLSIFFSRERLSRYSDYCERTYRRQFEAGLGLEGLNQALIEQVSADNSAQIVVVACTFTEKSGRHTYGLDWFYNGKTQRAERGLEWSVVAVVDLGQKTGYALSAQQTEAGLGAQAPASADESTPPKAESTSIWGIWPIAQPTFQRGFATWWPMASIASTNGPSRYWAAPQRCQPQVSL